MYGSLACFFFSSRRRHTRFDCDWSSDVCSSDLTTGPCSRAGAQSRRGLEVRSWAMQPEPQPPVNLSRPQPPHGVPVAGEGLQRSEEHTSELQSQSNLVCRLLLEKKKKQYHNNLTQQQLTN